MGDKHDQQSQQDSFSCRPYGCRDLFLTGFTSCACWVLTAWPLNVKPRLRSKCKHWSMELCLCVCVCVSVQEEQDTIQALARHTCNNILEYTKKEKELKSWVWKSCACCKNLKANLTCRLIWIQNKTRSYKKIKTNIPRGENYSLLWATGGGGFRWGLVFTWWSSSPAWHGPEGESDSTALNMEKIRKLEGY